MYPNVPQPQEPAGPTPAPVQPAYYPPYPQAPAEHPRVAVVGIMNLVFSFPYILLTVLVLLGASNPLSSLGMGSSYEMDFSAILNMIGLGLGGLLLLIGGINLLSHRANGKQLTQVAAGLITAVLAFNAVISIANLGKYLTFASILSVLLTMGLLVIYPIVAAIVINRKPEELGLE